MSIEKQRIIAIRRLYQLAQEPLSEIEEQMVDTLRQFESAVVADVALDLDVGRCDDAAALVRGLTR